MKGKRAENPPEEASGPELKLTPPPDGKKEKKPEKKKWSGTWVEKETTRIDRDGGGRICIVSVKANQTDERRALEDVFDQFTEAEIITMDEGRKGHGTILTKATKANQKKPGADVLTMTLQGNGSFAAFVGRNVTVSGRQKKLPIGEEQGEPR